MRLDAVADHLGLRGKIFRALIGSFAVSVLAYRIVFLAAPPFSPMTLSVELRAPNDLLEVFYKSRLRDEYNLSDIRTAAITKNRQSERIEVHLPPHSIGFIRIDPATKPAVLELDRICLRRDSPPLRERCWNPAEIQQDFISRQHISVFDVQNDAVHIENIGTDPYFETRPELESFLREYAAGDSSLQWLLVCLIFCFVFVCFRQASNVPIFLHPGIKLLGLVLFGVCFLASTAHVRRITPPLQGPDEFEHLGKLISIETNQPCGLVPQDLVELQSTLAYLPHHPEAKWRDTPFVDSSDHGGFVAVENGTCRYRSLYLMLPTLVNMISGSSIAELPLLPYLRRARLSVSISALLFFLVILVTALYGRPLFGTGDRSEFSFRGAALLSVIYVAFLPQVLWICSTLGQDYLLIAAGSALAVSLFFRIPILSDLLIAFSLFAATSKVVYLVPFLVLAAGHYAVRALSRAPESRLRTPSGAAKIAALAGCGLAGAFALFAPLSRFYCRNHYCYGLEDSGFVQSWAAFIGEAKRMVGEFRVLGLPSKFHHESAFGNFGWLDAPMPTHYAQLYSAPIMWILAVALLATFLLFAGAAINKIKVDRDAVAASILLGTMAVLYWVLAFFSIYLIFHVMVHWCGKGSVFGCAYQRRYELPLYPPIVLAIFVFGFEAVTGLAANIPGKKMVGGALFIVLLTAQATAIWSGWRAELAVLSDRYSYTDDAPL